MRLFANILVSLFLAAPLCAEVTPEQLIEGRATQYISHQQARQDALHHATLPLFIASLSRAKSFTIREGPPHRIDEKPDHETARPSLNTRIVLGEIVYAAPLISTPSDTETLHDLLSRPATYQSYTGPRIGQAFHADYAIEWTTDDGAFSALVCFGCRTIKLGSNSTTLFCDLPDSALTSLSTPTAPPPPLPRPSPMYIID